MRSRLILTAFVAAALTAMCLSALAAPSGLNVIPTTDVLDAGTMSLEAESAGNGRPWGDGCDSFALLQFGAGNGVELGFDHCTNDPNSWLNVKWRPVEESDRLPAVAIGVQGIGEGDLSQPYLALTRSFGDTRIHTGALRIDSRTSWFAGLDRPLGGPVTLQADYISGAENPVTCGIAVGLSDSLSLTLAGSWGNNGETGDGFIANVAWSTSFGR